MRQRVQVLVICFRPVLYRVRCVHGQKGVPKKKTIFDTAFSNAGKALQLRDVNSAVTALTLARTVIPPTTGPAHDPRPGFRISHSQLPVHCAAGLRCAAPQGLCPRPLMMAAILASVSRTSSCPQRTLRVSCIFISLSTREVSA